MADLNATLDRQHATAVGSRVAGHDIARIRHHLRFGQVAAPIHAGDVHVFLVAAANPIAHDCDLAVHHQLDGFAQTNRPQIARLAAEVVFNFGHRGKPETGHAGQLADFDFVHLMIAAQQQQPDLGRQRLAGRVHAVSGQNQRLHGGSQWQTQHLSHRRAGAFARRWQSRARLLRRRPRSAGGGRFGLFHIGRVVACRGVNDGVFAGGGNHLEFFAQVAANRTAVSRHRTVAQTEAVKNLAVSLRHDLVADFGSVDVAVKAVGVFHGEFTPTHQAKTGPALIAELGLDLVQVFG